MHIGEREALNKEKELLLNGSKVMKALGGAYAALGGESGVAVGAEECAALLESAAKFYPEAEEAAKTMRGLAYELAPRGCATLPKVLNTTPRGSRR